jgi:hypothetical protein
VGMSQIRETKDTVPTFSTESLTESKYLGVINSTDETGKKLAQITSAPKASKWARGPTILHVFAFLDSTIICQLYKLTFTDQAQVTLQLRLSLSHFVYIILVGLPFLGGGEGAKNF